MVASSGLFLLSTRFPRHLGGKQISPYNLLIPTSYCAIWYFSIVCTMATLLNRKRGAIKHKLTSFSNYVKPIYEDFSDKKEISQLVLIELRIRYDKFQLLLEEFEEIQIQIEESCSDEDLPQQYTERDIFNESFTGILAIAKIILEFYENESKSNSIISNPVSNTNAVTGNTNNIGFGVQMSNVKLPSINLPKFNGQFNSWLEFKDLFQSLIHDNQSLSNIEKYHYLFASLEGDSLKIIQSLEFSSNNYDVAWSLLKNRFDNSRLLVHNHIKAIFQLDTLTKETSTGLRNLIDNMHKHLRALNTLEQKTENWDTLLIYIVTSKFDKSTSREWENFKSQTDFPTLEELTNFMQSRATLLETLEINHQDNKLSKGHDGRGHHTRQHVLMTTQEKKCNFCQQNHLIYYCEKFLSLSINDRYQQVRQLRLCSNCLCKGHGSKICKMGPCKHCKQKHNSLLHFTKPPPVTSNATSHSQDHNSQVNYQVYVNHQHTNANSILLSTVVFLVKDSDNNYHECRALLDSGSQSNFISKKMVKLLKLKEYPSNTSIVGINNVATNLNTKCNAIIKSMHNNYSLELTCFVLPRITNNLPSFSFDISQWNIPKHIILADPTFNYSRNVDMLLGAHYFWSFFLSERISLGYSLPILCNTKFGWVLSGPLPDSHLVQTAQCYFTSTSDLDCDLKQFWEIETDSISQQRVSKDDELCEKHFIENVTKSDKGHFMVKIPFKFSPTLLGDDSKSIAIKRFCNLESKFKVNSEYHAEYIKFMDEYIKSGHMSLLSSISNNLQYFIPHHGVFKMDSLTTKLRVVFDASTVTNSGYSLNNLQYVGPSLQNNIFSILLRFRQHPIVITGDIKQMYRQIYVHPDDRSLQCIVWRSNPNEELKSYCLNTVTYGLTSAPFLALRCIKKLSDDFLREFPKASTIISRDFYIDDLITGFDSIPEAISVCQDILNILDSASFKLRKWSSNKVEVLEALQDSSDPMSVVSFIEHTTSKPLGIQWVTNLDVLTYKMPIFKKPTFISKRNMLSSIAKLFDPLGLISPCILYAKILLQQLWSLKLDWDELVPEDIMNKWIYFIEQLNCLDSLQISRYISKPNPLYVELHGFCDASQNAYGCCVYLRTVQLDGKVNFSLLCAKTKVAPIKQLSIPRLELCGAVILARLMDKVKNSLVYNFDSKNIYLWTDSQIILCWISTSPKQLLTFVGNRVAEIQSLSDPKCWRYIPGVDNPADMASRGVTPDILVNSTLWWNGPSWLLYPKNQWCHASVDIQEHKEMAFITTVSDLSIFNKFSNLQTLQRVFTYMHRFLYNCKHSHACRRTGPLTVQELKQSTMQLVKLVQKTCYANEIAILSSEDNLPKKHKLLALRPFVDSDGLLRVGGRLSKANISFSSKHPLLLPGNHVFTKLLFTYEHVKLLHAGPQLLLSTIRQTYWPTGGMSVAKSVVRSCIICFKHMPRSVDILMANLPESRVNANRVFGNCGIDYAGPFFIKDKPGRGCKLIKAYICLFICMATKCIHLELVSSLSTENFILALRRFVSRRGKPSHIYSDNGTNFIGANRELKQLYDFLKTNEDKLVQACAVEHITWHFIPPNSPHFGGLWEAGIKSTKYHLIRVLRDTKLLYEEFNTVLIQIEGTLNSRPLYPLSQDPSDNLPLTPSHFLIGQSLTTVPDPSISHVPVNRMSRFQFLQKLHHDFWKRWSVEYLHHLQQRLKWKSSSKNLAVDTLVLIRQDNLPPAHWLLGRVTAVHPGSDDVVRVASVRTVRGIIKRPVTRLCPLPLIESD